MSVKHVPTAHLPRESTSPKTVSVEYELIGSLGKCVAHSPDNQWERSHSTPSNITAVQYLAAERKFHGSSRLGTPDDDEAVTADAMLDGIASDATVIVASFSEGPSSCFPGWTFLPYLAATRLARETADMDLCPEADAAKEAMDEQKVKASLPFPSASTPVEVASRATGSGRTTCTCRVAAKKGKGISFSFSSGSTITFSS